MAVAMYLKVAGATGESKDSQHVGWIDVKSFSFGATQPHSVASGGGAGVGRVSIQDLNIVADIDKAYTAIFSHCTTGKHLDSVELSLNKAGETQIEYCNYKLTEVLVTNVTVSGTTGGETTGVTYSFQAARVETEYSEQTAQGSKGASSKAGWDTKKNVKI